jgi:hypothetical protein
MIVRFKSWAAARPWLADAAAGLGFVVYALLGWRLAYHLTTGLDESMYIYKGWLFVSGRYLPFEDFGPLTNHMPLSFIIPGAVQHLFGQGMETGRLFAYTISLLMLAGLWLTVRRLGGGGWAAGVVWLMVFTPAWQEVFAQGLSQGLVNTFMIWGFYFLVGEERQHWQLGLSAGLLALTVMTRINTLPVFGLALLYVFWQRGWRKGLAAAAAGGLVSAVVLFFFWPEALKFISGWVPEGLSGYVDAFRSPYSQQHVPEGFGYFPLSAWVGDPQALQWNGLLALAEALNFAFVPILTVLAVLVFWPARMSWPDEYHRRLALFLLSVWLVMAGMHLWVALSGESCPFFCLAGYFTFFNFAALLLISVVFLYLQRQPPVWRKILGFVLLFAIVLGALHKAGFRPKWVFYRWYRIMHTPIPRISDGRILLEESGLLLGLFESKLGLSYAFMIEELPTYLYWVLLTLLVFGLAPALRALLRKRVRFQGSVAWFAFFLFIIGGVALGPTAIFYGETPGEVCPQSVVVSHEQAATELAEMIEPGALVFWDVPTNMLLLYLPEVEIFPPQLNNEYNFVYSSDPKESEQIFRVGFWDDHLRENWIMEADYLVIAGQQIRDWQPRLRSTEFVLAAEIAPYEGCLPDETVISVLKPGAP